MSFIRHKILKGKKYAYEITAYWDPETKKAKQRSKYLGIVDTEGNIAKASHAIARIKERLILDFGDGYFLHQAMQATSHYETMKSCFSAIFEELMVLIFYRISMQSAMYNCESWLSGNVLSKLYPNADVSSQHISRILAKLGDESLQRDFFTAHIQQLGGVKKSVIIDATSLPNAIQSGFNQWGRSDGSIEKQFRLLCVLDQDTQLPLFYRYLPGNITDVSTLKNTLTELIKMGVESSFVLLDAGYFSESNIHQLYEEKIDFMSRLPASRKIYKELINDHHVEQVENAIKYGTRGLFAQCKKINLYGHEAYAYIVMDPARKGKEMNQLLLEHFEEQGVEKIDPIEFNRCGVMILVSSREMPTNEVVKCYYARQSVEQVFGYYKDDLGVLPIRRHSEATIRGYLFLQFLSLLFFIQLRHKLHEHSTVEQALLSLRHLKCKVFDKELLVSEATKPHKEIFKLFNFIMPNLLGI